MSAISPKLQHGLEYFSTRQSYNFGRFSQMMREKNPEASPQQVYQDCLQYFKANKDEKYRTQRDFAIQELRRVSTLPA